MTNPPPVQKTPKYVITKNGRPQWERGVFDTVHEAREGAPSVSQQRADWSYARCWIAVAREKR